MSEFAGIVAGISPVGTFWSGPPADRFRAAIVQSMQATVDFIDNLAKQMTPFATEYKSVLDQWHEYLARVDCVPTPTDIEELRALVLALLGANSSVFTTGLQDQILAYLPLVLVHDDRPISHVPLPIPSPIDSGRATITVWYSALEENDPFTIDCVARALAPAVSTIRLVTPGLTFSNPTAGTLAGDLGLHWVEMTDNARANFELYNAFAILVDTGMTTPAENGSALASDVLGATGPGVNVSGYRLDASFAADWAPGGSRVVVQQSYTWP